ncbi:glutathione S-transferase protein [Teladorsagia circumcincta]|uniref:Glutathione S-transferase protein n=1 Tax=Teladorsagia circumcincta TaxID=45464 RepID=A0A2G9UGU2_TELCI|nr:glutathione S-transferase protein [Teladorsagia circumcincta]
MLYSNDCWSLNKNYERQYHSAEMRMLIVRWACGRTRLDRLNFSEFGKLGTASGTEILAVSEMALYVTECVEVVNVNLSDKPKFLFEKHPDGKVPILEHNNKTIIESTLIAEYLDWISPAKPILPTDPYLKARQRMITAQLEAKVCTS